MNKKNYWKIKNYAKDRRTLLNAYTKFTHPGETYTRIMPHTKRKCDNDILNLLVVSENTYTTLLLLAYAVLVIINKQTSKKLNSKPFWVEAKEF